MTIKIAAAAELEAAEALARQALDLGVKGDKEAYLALFCEDGIVEMPFNESGRTEEGFYRRYSGSVELRKYIEEALSAEGSADIYERQYTVSADAKSVFVEARGEVMMVTGKNYRNRYVFKFELRDGKIARFKEYYNPITSGIAFGRKLAGKVVIDAPPEEGMLVGGLAKP